MNVRIEERVEKRDPVIRVCSFTDPEGKSLA